MRRSFSLVELLVVISILAALMSLLVPALGGMNYRAKVVDCLNNLKSMGQVWSLYAYDNGDLYPDTIDPRGQIYRLGANGEGNDLRPMIADYLEGTFHDRFICKMASPTWKLRRKGELHIDVDTLGYWYNDGTRNYGRHSYTFAPTSYAMFFGKHSNEFFDDEALSRMERVGDQWSITKTVGTKKEEVAFSVMMGDWIYRHGLTGMFRSTHYPQSHVVNEAGDFINQGPLNWDILLGMEVSANFLWEDGSARPYYGIHHFSLGYPEDQREFFFNGRKASASNPDSYVVHKDFIWPAEDR